LANIGSLSVTLGLSSASFIGGLGRAQGALSAFAGQAKATLSNISVSGTGLMGGLLAGVGSISGIVQSAISSAADMEALELSFEGIAGGAEKARALVKDIASFAAETPFETMPLANSVKLLSTMGFEARTSLQIIQKLGDVIAASGKGSEGLNQVALALGQIRLMGRLQGQDAMQLTNAGIPIWDALAKRLKKSTAEVRHLSEQGGIDAKTAIMAVLDVADDPKFKGSQERLSKSLGGLWSTLKDNTTLALADIGKIIAEAFDLRGTATAVTSFIGVVRANLVTLQAPLRAIGALFLAVRDVALEGFTRLMKGLAGLTTTFGLDKMNFDGLRASMTNFLEWMANKVQDLGGLFLKYIVAPMAYGLSRVMDGIGAMVAGLARTPLFKNAEVEKVGVELRNASDELRVWQFHLTRIGDSLLKNHGTIKDMFAGVREGAAGPQGWKKAMLMTLGQGIGIAGQLGLFPKPPGIDLGIADQADVAKHAAKQLAPSALRNSTAAYSSAVQDMAQRIGGANSVPELLKQNKTEVVGVRQAVDKLAAAVQQNGVGLVNGKGA